MRSRLVFAILILVCVLVVMTIPASAAPAQQQGGWTSTHYILIDGTSADRQPTVVYSDIAGVRVTRDGGVYTVRFLRPYRFLIATAYGVCADTLENCAELSQGVAAIDLITWHATQREWLIYTSSGVHHRPYMMISLIVKP
ncbi:MAG: hypothetical protein IAE85_06445 [Anaerolinea sp.]|nr:hypothetical protein [Anaerolinea sp.]